MRYLRYGTATIVTVGPFLDKTDGVTLETGLTITNERISMTVDSNAGSAPTLVLDNVTGATSGTDNDLNYISGCDAALMQLELSASNTTYYGRAIITITDAANHCPVWHEFIIVPAMIYDSLVAGTDTLQADVTQYNGTAGTFASGRPEVNTSHIAGSAVSASTAQIGANVVNIAGSAVNTANAQVGANLVNVAGSAVSTTTAQIGCNVVQTAGYTFTTGAVVDDALNSATTFETNLSASANDHHNDAYLLFTSGTLAGQVRKITDYDGTSKFVTCDAFTAEPTAADAFVVVNR